MVLLSSSMVRCGFVAFMWPMHPNVENETSGFLLYQPSNIVMTFKLFVDAWLRMNTIMLTTYP